MTVTAGPPCTADRGASPPCLHGGRTPPPPLALGGWHHPALPQEYTVAVIYCGVTATQDRGGFNHLEESLNSSIHTRVHSVADVFSAATLSISIGGMDLGRGGEIVRVHLHPRLLHRTAELALRETSAKPCRSGCCDMSSSGLFNSGTGPYSQLGWPWTSRHPSCYINVSFYLKPGW